MDQARGTRGQFGATTVDSGLSYGGVGAVEVRIRKREHRYDLSDRATAVTAAGKPPGWLEIAEEVVAQEGMNVNRRGVVFVSAVEGRDIAALALRVADASLAVYSALLDYEAEPLPSM